MAVGALIFDDKQKKLVQFGREFWVEDGEKTISRLKDAKFEAEINILRD